MKIGLGVWVAVLACGLFASPAQAQETASAESGVTGNWLGALNAGAFKLRLLVKITGQPGALTGTMDSIDQGAKDIPVSAVTLKDDDLHFEVASIGGTFDGRRSADGKQITGTWTQGANSLPLTLTKTAQAPPPPRRPQEPKPPYPYAVREVTFDDAKAGVKLVGTLTMPRGKGPFPAVILIAGSGPHGRDEEVFGHRLFLVLADYLTRRGIAVLRYDKRGIGQSTGDYARATSVDFTDDALAAVQYLKAVPLVDPRRIGLIGHSEGGLIAPLAATRSPHDIAFLVLMAGPGLTGEQILLRQSALISRGMGASETAIQQEQAVMKKTYAIVKSDPDDASARQKIMALTAQERAALPPAARGASEKQAVAQIAAILSPWLRFFLAYDPAPILRRVRCPVLALNGSRDMQVPPKEDLAAIAAALKAGGNRDGTIRELPGLNHLFQTAPTGLPSEYAAIEETISPSALQVIAQWIGKHTARANADIPKRRT